MTPVVDCFIRVFEIFMLVPPLHAGHISFIFIMGIGSTTWKTQPDVFGLSVTSSNMHAYIWMAMGLAVYAL